MKKLLLIGIMATFLSGCAQEPQLLKQTASGKAESEYPNNTPEQVMDAIVQRCNERGFVIEDQSKNYVICSKQMEGAQSMLTQIAIGNAYSTTPQVKVRYSVSKFKSGAKAWAESWAETQMAFGQIQRAPLNNNSVRNELQSVLDKGISEILNR